MASTQRVLLSVEEYLAEVLALVRPLADTERVPLAEAAGRTLAEPVLARAIARAVYLARPAPGDILPCWSQRFGSGA